MSTQRTTGPEICRTWHAAGFMGYVVVGMVAAVLFLAVFGGEG